MLWCLFNDQRHSQKWQPSLLKLFNTTCPALSQETEKGFCSPKKLSPPPVATGGGEWAMWCGVLASPTLLWGWAGFITVKGILLERGYGSFNIRNLLKRSFLHSPPPVLLDQEITYLFWSSYFWNLSWAEPYAKVMARVKASLGSFKGASIRRWCRAGADLLQVSVVHFPLHWIWDTKWLSGWCFHCRDPPPVDESCLGLALAVVGRFQSWVCKVSAYVARASILYPE